MDELMLLTDGSVSWLTCANIRYRIQKMIIYYKRRVE
jgi:hypothetical protein